MATAKKIVKNTLVLTVAQIVGRITQLLSVAIMARYLGDRLFGSYNFYIAFTFVFVIFSDLGLNVLINREISRDNNLVKKLATNALVIKFFSSLFTLVLVALVGYLTGIRGNELLLAMLVAAGLLCEQLALMYRGIFRAFERMEYEALVDIILRVVRLLMIIVAVKKDSGIQGLIYAILFSSILYVIYTFILCQMKFIKGFSKPGVKEWRYYIGLSFPLVLTTLFNHVYIRIDSIMLKFMQSEIYVGWYSAAYKLVLALDFLPGAFTAAVFPSMAVLYLKDRGKFLETLKITVRILLIIALPISLGGMLLATNFITAFYGHYEYLKPFQVVFPFFGEITATGSVTAFQILIWVTLLNFMNYPLGYALIAMDRQKLTSITYGTCAVFNILINLYMIKEFNYIGASIATLLTEIMIFSFEMFFVRKFAGFFGFLNIVLKPLLAGIFMGVFLLIFRNPSWNIPLPALVLSGGAIYFTGLVVVKEIGKPEFEILRKILNKEKISVKN